MCKPKLKIKKKKKKEEEINYEGCEKWKQFKFKRLIKKGKVWQLFIRTRSKEALWKVYFENIQSQNQFSPTKYFNKEKAQC